jgi:hypothetical protein
MNCLDAAHAPIQTCAEHAAPGGMDGDDGPWEKFYAPAVAEVESILKESDNK